MENRILKRMIMANNKNDLNGKYKEDLNELDLNTEHYKRKILGYITIIEDYLSKIKRNVDENDLIQCAITSYDVEYNVKKFAQVCNEIADEIEKNRIV